MHWTTLISPIQEDFSIRPPNGMSTHVPFSVSSKTLVFELAPFGGLVPKFPKCSKEDQNEPFFSALFGTCVTSYVMNNSITHKDWCREDGCSGTNSVSNYNYLSKFLVLQCHNVCSGVPCVQNYVAIQRDPVAAALPFHAKPGSELFTRTGSTLELIAAGRGV